MTLESDDGYIFQATRKIEESDTGDKGASTVTVATDLPEVKGTEYRIARNEYSNLLLSLIGIDQRVKIIGTQAPKEENLTMRTLFHFFFINEDHIFGKPTAFDIPEHSRITASLTSLLYLCNGDDLNRYLPRVSVEELYIIATQKSGVIKYLNEKIMRLTEQKKLLEASLAAEPGIDIEVKIDELMNEIFKYLPYGEMYFDEDTVT